MQLVEFSPLTYRKLEILHHALCKVIEHETDVVVKLELVEKRLRLEHEMQGMSS